VQPELDPTAALLAFFRRHASGVAVITMIDEAGKPYGFTATSVTSLGAKPPLATFNVASGSSSWAALCTSTYVAMHTLTDENLDLAIKMSSPHELRFASDDWMRGPHDLPVFTAASSVAIGKVREIHNVESNAVVIVDVEQGLVGEGQGALLYFQREYRRLGEALTNRNS
jgi:flavin reductase (DIM6/NTAB) family NADH-FMN oxidoreductase RutF